MSCCARRLIDLFVRGAIGAPEFETRYLSLVKADETIRL
jgi:hypothetical protein